MCCCKKYSDNKGELQWSTSAYPSGLPTFIQKLHGQKLKFGIYGAASGVTCGNNPGQTYFEDEDAKTYVKWGVDYLKRFVLYSPVQNTHHDAFLAAIIAPATPLTHQFDSEQCGVLSTALALAWCFPSNHSRSIPTLSSPSR
jgi:hypothetical protein